MAIRTNRNYNDPSLGAAFSNLAAAFGPPSGSDLAGYAAANAKNAEASRLASLFDAAGSSDFNQTVFDRQAIATGLYNPTQGFYAQDQNNATARYGVDVGASTSRANNAADNDRELVTAIMKSATNPVAQGAVRPGFNPSDYGVSGVPAVPEFAGRVSPLSETQWKAGQNQRLLDNGTMTDQMLVDTIVGDKTPVQAVGQNGKPTFMSPGEAVRSRAEPFVKSTGATETKNYKRPDGAVGTAFFDDQANQWRDTATQEALPQGAITFNSSLQGGAEETGLGKPVVNAAQKQLIDISVAKDTATQLRNLIASAPASQGVVGMLRGTAQNLIQTGGEVGQFFGGDVQVIQDRIKAGLEDASLGGAFDPNIPAIEMMSNLLAFQYAKTTTSERLSNEMLAASRRALGLDGLTANQASSLARIDQAVKMIERQEGILRSALGGDGGAIPTAPSAPTSAPPPPPSPSDIGVGAIARNPATGERRRWTGSQWELVK